MKSYLLLFILLALNASLSSCQKEDNEESYLKEYKRYKSDVSYYMGTLEDEFADTLKCVVDTMVMNLAVQSCFYCPALINQEISPEAFHKLPLFIAYNLFIGEDSRLKFIFQDLFKLIYSEEYSLMLEEFDMKEAVDWSDTVKEFDNIPMKNMFEKYIEVEFETD